MGETGNTSFNPIATGLGNTIGSIAGIAYDAYQQNKQREWNEKMYNQQNAWNLEMWNKQNEYNTPANQVQRLRDAGLNPLYYGLDGSSAGAVNAATPLEYDRSSMNGMSNPLQAGIDSAIKTKMANAQEKLALSGAHRNESEADLADAKAITENLMRNRTYDLMGVQIDLNNANIHLTQEQARKLGADIQQVEKQVEKMDAEIVETYSKIDVAQRGIKLQEATFEFEKWLNGQKLDLQSKEIAVQWYNANTQRLIGEADIQLKGEQKAYIQLEGEKAKAVTATENATREGKVKSLEISNKTGERAYKWMPVTSTVDVVKTAATAAGSIMLGTGAITGAAKLAGTAGYTISNTVQ